jgi:glycerol transport system ATP-binding protein
VVVMHEGSVVQVGTPVELFERPQHTFVGHFIGSPGMNVLPCEVHNGAVLLSGRPVLVANPPTASLNGKRLEIGVRPEFVTLAEEGIPGRVVRVSDAGRYRIVEVQYGDGRIKLLVDESAAIPTDVAHLQFAPPYTRLYADDRVVE